MLVAAGIRFDVELPKANKRRADTLARLHGVEWFSLNMKHKSGVVLVRGGSGADLAGRLSTNAAIHRATMAFQEKGPEWLPAQILVAFEEDFSQVRARAFLALSGLPIARKLYGGNTYKVFVVPGKEWAWIRHLRRSTYVRYAQPNYLKTLD